MKPVEQEILVVKKSALKREYDFFFNEKLIANLNYIKTYGGKAKARIGDKEWIFLRKGFWKQFVEIQAEQSPYEKKRIEFDWRRRAKIEGPDGNLYQLRQTNCWKSIWSWLDDKNASIGVFKSNMLSRKKRGTIRFSQPLKEDLLWLLVLGWFMLVSEEDNAVAAAG
jgi:hypothetical protein